VAVIVVPSDDDAAAIEPDEEDGGEPDGEGDEVVEEISTTGLLGPDSE